MCQNFFCIFHHGKIEQLVQYLSALSIESNTLSSEVYYHSDALAISNIRIEISNTNKYSLKLLSSNSILCLKACIIWHCSTKILVRKCRIKGRDEMQTIFSKYANVIQTINFTSKIIDDTITRQDLKQEITFHAADHIGY